MVDSVVCNLGDVLTYVHTILYQTERGKQQHQSRASRSPLLSKKRPVSVHVFFTNSMDQPPTISKAEPIAFLLFVLSQEVVPAIRPRYIQSDHRDGSDNLEVKPHAGVD